VTLSSNDSSKQDEEIKMTRSKAFQFLPAAVVAVTLLVAATAQAHLITEAESWSNQHRRATAWEGMKTDDQVH
jgi:hypothetical protein